MRNVGYAAGGWWNDKGSPTNYLCLPPDPISSGKSVSSGCNHLFGVEYETTFWGTHSHNEDAPCAVCSAASETTLLMIPGRDSCYPGWTKQYNGYLGTNRFDNVGATNMFVWTNFLSTLTAENGPQTAHCFILSPTNVEPCNALLTPVTKSSAALFVQSRVKYLSILTMETFLKDFTSTVHLANKWKCANPTTLNTSC